MRSAVAQKTGRVRWGAGWYPDTKTARVATGRDIAQCDQLAVAGCVLLPAGVLSTEWITWLCSKYTMNFE